MCHCYIIITIIRVIVVLSLSMQAVSRSTVHQPSLFVSSVLQIFLVSRHKHCGMVYLTSLLCRHNQLQKTLAQIFTTAGRAVHE